MEFLRKLVHWIGQHRIISAALLLLLLGALLINRFLAARFDGVLSDPLQKGKIVQSVYGIGTVTANKSHQIKLGVICTIKELFVKEGDGAKKGEKLVDIDGIIYRAPFDGTVTQLPFKQGENVFTGLPILTFVDLLDRYLLVSLEQQGALRVKSGQKVKISFDTVRELVFDGQVQAVYSNESGFLARIGIAELPPYILPGMTADVAITLREVDEALLAPVAALDQDSLWVKRSMGLPVLIPVKTGIVDKAMAEITEGDVHAGDRVLIRRKLRP